MSYPTGVPIKTSSRAPSAVPESREGGVTPTKTPVEQQQPPIGITMNLPSNVMFFEEPQVAVWDETGGSSSYEVLLQFTMSFYQQNLLNFFCVLL